MINQTEGLREGKVPRDIQGILRYNQNQRIEDLIRYDGLMEFIRKDAEGLPDRIPPNIKFKDVAIDDYIRKVLSIAKYCMFCLSEAERSNGVRLFTRGVIYGKGLEDKADDIISGIDRSMPSFHTEEFPDLDSFIKDDKKFFENAEISYSNGIDYIMNYIDRWEMYHNLFGESKK